MVFEQAKKWSFTENIQLDISFVLCCRATSFPMAALLVKFKFQSLWSRVQFWILFNTKLHLTKISASHKTTYIFAVCWYYSLDQGSAQMDRIRWIGSKKLIQFFREGNSSDHLQFFWKPIRSVENTFFFCDLMRKWWFLAEYWKKPNISIVLVIFETKIWKVYIELRT